MSIYELHHWEATSKEIGEYLRKGQIAFCTDNNKIYYRKESGEILQYTPDEDILNQLRNYLIDTKFVKGLYNTP